MTKTSNFAVARAWLRRGLRSAERGDLTALPALVRPLSVSQMLLGASGVGELLRLAISSNSPHTRSATL